MELAGGAYGYAGFRGVGSGTDGTCAGTTTWRADISPGLVPIGLSV